MKGIYTCPYCLRSYSVEREGDYMCDCGRHFFYPPMQSSKSAKYSVSAPVYIDSSSKSVRKKTNVNVGRKSRTKGGSGEDCPLARVALVCGIIGIIFFGILSIPALILGVSARSSYRIRSTTTGATTWPWAGSYSVPSVRYAGATGCGRCSEDVTAYRSNGDPEKFSHRLTFAFVKILRRTGRLRW